jgi:hypothetical protein
MPCVIMVKAGKENVKALVIEISEKLKGSVPRKKKSLGWAMLLPTL